MRLEAIENPPFVMPIASYSYLFPDASNSPFRGFVLIAEQIGERYERIDLSSEIIVSSFVLIAEQVGERYEWIVSPEVVLDANLESNEQSRETQGIDPLLGLAGTLECKVTDTDNTMPKEMRQANVDLDDTDREARMTYAEAQFRQLCASRGLDWDAMSEVEREDFVDDLIHEDRECSR